MLGKQLLTVSTLRLLSKCRRLIDQIPSDPLRSATKRGSSMREIPQRRCLNKLSARYDSTHRRDSFYSVDRINQIKAAPIGGVCSGLVFYKPFNCNTLRRLTFSKPVFHMSLILTPETSILAQATSSQFCSNSMKTFGLAILWEKFHKVISVGLLVL